MTDLWSLGTSDLASLYRNKQASPVEALRSVLERVKRLNPRVNALFAITPERAFELALRSEKRWHRGEPLSAIDGVPTTVKDSVAMAAAPYWRGCRANRARPAPTADSPPVARMKAAGAVIFAKTTMPDFGIVGAGVSSAHGVTRNPWNEALNTGGSSAGGGASLAAGLGALTVGTDLAGSIRLPCSLCGVVGLKPTQGRVPHLPPSAIRSAGPMARNVRDAATLMTILSGPDARDFGSLQPDGVDYAADLSRSLEGARIGLALGTGFSGRVVPEVREAIERAATIADLAGAVVTPVERLTRIDAMAAVDIVMAMRARLEYDALPSDARPLVIPYVRSCCERALTYSAIEYVVALEQLEIAKAEVAKIFESVDYLITPAVPGIGFPADRVSLEDHKPLDHLCFLVMFNQTGQPAAVVNCGFAPNGLPIGLQIVGRRFDDLGVLQLAQAFEAQLDARAGLAKI